MPYFFVYPFAVSGDKTVVPTNDPLTGSMSYQDGFTENYQLVLGTDPDAIPVPRDQSNQLYFDITENLRQYQTQAIPNWITAADNNPGGVPTAFAYDLYAQVRYDDGSGVKIYENLVQGNTDTPGVSVSSWLVISGNAQGDAPGTIISFGGTSAPLGYLVCDGSAQLRIGIYARLFAAIGTTWGAGNGTTTFNVPDLRGRVLMHRGGSAVPNIPTLTPNGIGNAVGNVGGASTITLEIAQMPNHNHSGSTVAIRLGRPQDTGGGAGIVSGGSTAVTVTPQGGGGAHNNVQMSAVVLMCIKY